MDMSKEQFLEGQVLLIEKPLNWTSFQVVNKVRWLIRKRFDLKKIKVGHAGTLDPLATGLLILCTGKMTKRIAEFQGQDKTYTGSFVLGATTPSADLETEIDQRFPTDHLNEDTIKEAATSFVGEIQQQPPIFSAVKKDGKRLYEHARKGEDVEIPWRTIQVHRFDLTHFNMPQVDFEIECGKGTYIRSLARDLGKALDNGAYLQSLRRTRIGDFKVENAWNLEDFEQKMKS
ncbi:tRNA pseudouridine(55) synthase TruB [Aureitalea marina]|uniref:tRNA pseudouridine synthase B n=1 Tax=Aureitalea marina TaxID=930804 RepID=A0A2S7KT57_9FLAO|nr:tRNA pseudouridine(55) synthase TruB [Aureitalea marina]PQB05815.1 tRNA pseudouridine(55) synthase TruB [Aureitalea marina]